MIALAVDQSVSMQGFAATRAMSHVLRSAEQAIGAEVREPIAFYALAGTAAKVSEESLFDPRTYKMAGTDLEVALDVHELRDADIVLAFTDGQPTAQQPGAPLGICTPAGTQVITDLQRWLQARVDDGTAVWLVLEKVPFAGRYFLNCRGANHVPEIAGRIPGLQCNARECAYQVAKPLPRALVGVVLAKPAFSDPAAAIIERYLRERTDAIALRLHPSTHDRDTVDQVAADVVGKHTYRVDVQTVPGEPTTRKIHVRCPADAPELAVRVCVRMRAAAPGPGVPIARMSAPEWVGAQAVGTGRAVEDWLELPAGTSFDPAAFAAVNPAYRACASLWKPYLSRAHAGSSACTAEDGVVAHELITGCGCHPQRESKTELELVQRYHSAVADAQHALTERTLAADPQSWFVQPDRVNGLAELVQRFDQRRPDAAPSTVLRLILEVERP